LVNVPLTDKHLASISGPMLGSPLPLIPKKETPNDTLIEIHPVSVPDQRLADILRQRRVDRRAATPTDQLRTLIVKRVLAAFGTVVVLPLVLALYLTFTGGTGHVKEILEAGGKYIQHVLYVLALIIVALFPVRRPKKNPQDAGQEQQEQMLDADHHEGDSGSPPA
jgi:hypothetical protein